MDDDATFPQFTRLAPELRNKIWNLAMPQMGTEMLYFYRKGFWRFGILDEKNPDGSTFIMPGYESDNVVINFYHNSLDDIQLEIPLAFVNREARSIALPFIETHKLKTRLRDTSSYYPIFVRQMNLETDALYIGPDTWETFQSEPWQTWNPDDPDRSYYFKSPLRRLAIHQSQLELLGSLFPATMQNSFSMARELLIITNDVDDIELSYQSINKNNWWEFKYAESEPFVWNHLTAQVDYEGTIYKAEDSEMRTLITNTFNELHLDSDTSELHGFECRPGVVVNSST